MNHVDNNADLFAALPTTVTIDFGLHSVQSF